MQRLIRDLLPAAALVLAAATACPAQLAPTTAPSTAPASRPAPAPRTAASAVTPRGPFNAGKHADFLYRLKQGPIDLLFVGDSITDGWPRRGEYSWLKFAPYNPADFGVSAERTEHVLWRLNNGELDGISPKVVVVMIGTNNIGQNPPDTAEWAAAGVTKIVRTLHEKLPGSKILLLGVFPRDGKDSRTRADTIKINEIIKKLDDGKATRFLDIGKVFLDAEGEIPNDVMPDKLHPSGKGYDLWYDAMKPLLDEMMK